MSITTETFKEKWNQTSWTLAPAEDAIFALEAFGEWQNRLIEAGKSKTPFRTTFIRTIMILNNALVTEFFICACRIREESRTIYGLPSLLSDAEKLTLLDAHDHSAIKQLMDKTKPIYNKLKKIRGMTCAHLSKPANGFALLKDQGIKRAEIYAYLQQCADMFSILGKPIGHSINRNVKEEGVKVANEIRELLNLVG